MHLLVTGAGGFVGRALLARLLGDTAALPFDRLTLLDPRCPASDDPRVSPLEGSVGDPALLAHAFASPVDVVFHLASVPGGAAEQHYELARDVNLRGTEALLERGRDQVLAGGRPPVFVFASTVGVFAAPLPPQVDDATPLQPGMSYGAQKWIGEILVADFSRRGWIDGRSLRLPGVLARPSEATGQLSLFISELMHALAAGRPFTCPTSPQASTWASSIGNVVDNLLHGASVAAQRLPAGRALTLPTLRFTFAELAQAVCRRHGHDAQALVRWQPDPRIEALFGAFPPLVTAAADAAGFRRDRDLVELVRRALPAADGA